MNFVQIISVIIPIRFNIPDFIIIKSFFTERYADVFYISGRPPSWIWDDVIIYSAVVIRLWRYQRCPIFSGCSAVSVQACVTYERLATDKRTDRRTNRKTAPSLKAP